MTSPKADKPDKGKKPKILVEHFTGDPSQLPEGIIVHPSRGADAPPRISTGPQVIDDPVQIEQCRAMYESEMDRLFDAALKHVAAGEFVFHEHEAALRARRERAVQELRRIAKTRGSSAAGRVAAAKALITLGLREGEDLLFKALRSPSAELQHHALKVLRKSPRLVDLTAPDRAALLVSMMGDSDSEVSRAAVDLCAVRRIPGTEDRLVSMLSNGGAVKPPDRQQLALKLAEVVNKPGSIPVLIPHLLRGKPKEYSQWIGLGFRDALAHPDRNVSGPMRKALHNYTLKFTGKARYDQSLVRDLTATAGLDSLPVLQDIFAHAKDRVSLWYALEALARLQPGRAVGLILERIRAEGTYDMLLDMLRAHATEGDADAVLAAVLPAKSPRHAISESLVRLLLGNLGDAGRRAVEAHLDQLAPDARRWAMWKLRGIDLRSALVDLHAAGVIDSDAEELLEKMRAPRRPDEEDELVPEEKPFDLSNPHGLYGALSRAGLMTVFDVETAMYPCHHDWLILEFAEGSAGRFNPECPVQAWHAEREDDFDAPYTVQFLFNGRLYRFGAENFGDWYDAAAVQQALNFALTQAGFRHQFIALASDGQIANYVFADPAALLPIARRYALPLSENASEAMRKGKEYEKQISPG